MSGARLGAGAAKSKVDSAGRASKEALTGSHGNTYLGLFSPRKPFQIYTVNVQITDINETRKALTVTLDQGEVQGEYTSLIGEYTKQVSLPGFRPGKAPAAMVAARFGKEIKDEF